MATELATTRFDWPDWFFRRWADRFPFATEEPIKLEEYTEDGTMVVRAEVPGIDPDKDVELTVENGYLTMRVERREEKKEESKGRYRSEFHYGSFTRVVPLPAGATEADVKASYADGILEVRLPIDTAKTGARRIPIARGPRAS